MLKFLIFVCAFILVSCDSEFGTSSAFLHSNNSPKFPAFLDLGQYSGQTNEGVKYKKHYYFSKYFKSTWVEAKAICKSFDLELATFETNDETQNFFKKFATTYIFTNIDQYYAFVDGISLTPKSTADWYWTNSGLKISYEMKWAKGEPNHGDNKENCLSIGRANRTEELGFNDHKCHEDKTNFVCQKTFLL